jgi:hypothetical protein
MKPWFSAVAGWLKGWVMKMPKKMASDADELVTAPTQA